MFFSWAAPASIGLEFILTTVNYKRTRMNIFVSFVGTRQEWKFMILNLNSFDALHLIKMKIGFPK